MVRAFDERRKVIVGLLNQLPGVTCVNPRGAFYAFPNITGTGLTAKELQNAMLDKAGVATVAGTSFGINGEGYVRFSYANSSTTSESHGVHRHPAAGRETVSVGWVKRSATQHGKGGARGYLKR